MNSPIQTTSGKIYFWFDDHYKEKLKNGEKKQTLNRQQITNKLSQLGFQSDIGYKESGKPFLLHHPETEISISHSSGWYALYIAHNIVGVDIQIFNERIAKGKHYFMQEAEFKKFYQIVDLHIIWCAKEAFYKLLEGRIENSRTEILVHEIDRKKQSLKLEHSQKIYLLNYCLYEQFILVYTA